MPLMSYFKTLALRVSGGRDIALISQVNTLAFRVSGGGDLALVNHVKTLALRVSGGSVPDSDLSSQDSSIQSHWRRSPGSGLPCPDSSLESL